MKTLQKFILVFTLILFSGIMNLNAQTVYVTEKGKKYHAKNCDLVKTGKKGMELAAAKNLEKNGLKFLVHFFLPFSQININ
jgi:hypothetical protein